MIIVVRAAFYENNKYYPQVFLDECLYKLQKNIKILYYNRIEVAEGIDVKISKSKECDICHHWYFLNKGFKFQSYSAVVAMIY